MLFPCLDFIAQLLAEIVVLMQSLVLSAAVVEQAADLRDCQDAVEGHLLQGFVEQLESLGDLC